MRRIARRLAGGSTFTAAISPANMGVLLRRRMDYSVPRQQAGVYVDEILAGTWYDAGQNLGTPIPGFRVRGSAVAHTGQERHHRAYREYVGRIGLDGVSYYWVYSIGPNDGPRITRQSQPQRVDPHDPAVFSVVATGESPLGYRWQKNGYDVVDDDRVRAPGRPR